MLLNPILSEQSFRWLLRVSGRLIRSGSPVLGCILPRSQPFSNASSVGAGGCKTASRCKWPPGLPYIYFFFHQQMTQPSEITILASYLQRTLEAERMTRLVINSVQINAHTSLMPPSSLSPKPLGYSRLRTRVNAGVSTLAPWLLWVYGWLCQFWPQNPSFLESMVLWS